VADSVPPGLRVKVVPTWVLPPGRRKVGDVKLPRGAGDPKVLAAEAAPDAVVGDTTGDTMVISMLYVFGVSMFFE
jgi:hypothetical protein